MSTKTSECLSAAGIKTIVWIDDYFAAPTWEENVADIQRDVEKLKEQGKSKIELHGFDNIDLTQSKSKIMDLVDEVLEKMNEDEVGRLVPRLSVLAGTNVSVSSPKEDLLPADFKDLQNAFGSGLRTFSLKTWTSTEIGNLASYTEDTLFLIDREFHRESGGLGGMDGVKLLSDIVNKTPAYCVLLTHTCTEAAQEELRVTIATDTNLKPHRFGVLSKQQNTKLSIDLRFAYAIRAVMTYKYSGETAYYISEIIKQSAEETAKTLTKRSFPELEQALFVNATNEGVFEYDAILRVFGIEQNHALNLALKNSKIQNQLRAARKFREQISNLGLKKAESDMSFFRGLRRREIYLEGDGLNKLHAPLTCGDVFQDDNKNQFLFLAQPCDLMVRKNGKRKAEVGFMVLISDAPPDEKDAQLPDYRFYDLDGLLEDGKQSLVDLREFFVTDLSILDYAVFNEDGRVELKRDHIQPSIVLTKGWSLRMVSALARVFPDKTPPKVQNLCIGEYAAKLAGVSAENSLSYPFRRIGRLESNTASAILAAWATFQTRAAFEHDFAQNKIQKPVKISSPQPAETKVLSKTENGINVIKSIPSKQKSQWGIRKKWQAVSSWISRKLPD